jgi:hypothetical protein
MKLKNYYMKKENNEKLISQRVISKIEKGELKMKPKAYFVAKTILIVGLLTLVFLLALYFGSLIIFVLRINDVSLFQGMGFQVIRNVLLSFPWYLVFLTLTLVVLIELIAKRFHFIYRKPLIVSLFVILALVLLSSFLIERSSLHHSFFRLAEQERLPLAGRMYRDLGNLEIENVHFGTILEKKDDLWMMELDNGEAAGLRITEKTRSRRVFPEIEEGNKVIVIGELKEGLIDVESFKNIERRFRNHRKRTNER